MNKLMKEPYNFEDDCNGVWGKIKAFSEESNKEVEEIDLKEEIECDDFEED